LDQAFALSIFPTSPCIPTGERRCLGDQQALKTALTAKTEYASRFSFSNGSNTRVSHVAPNGIRARAVDGPGNPNGPRRHDCTHFNSTETLILTQHDAQLDYYGKTLATCSSDRTIKLFTPGDGGYQLVDTLRGHEGPVWQVAWAHPRFGNLLASGGYDGRIIVWKEFYHQGPDGNVSSQWQRAKEFEKTHAASVNSVAWAPHEHGLMLACASSDGKVSVHSCGEDGVWHSSLFQAHGIGVNGVSWAPAHVGKKLVTGGCDNLIKVWRFASFMQWAAN